VAVPCELLSFGASTCSLTFGVINPSVLFDYIRAGCGASRCSPNLESSNCGSLRSSGIWFFGSINGRQTTLYRAEQRPREGPRGKSATSAIQIAEESR